VFFPDDELAEARFHKIANLGGVLCARSVEPFEPCRPWVRRARTLCKLNGISQRIRVAAKLCKRGSRNCKFSKEVLSAMRKLQSLADNFRMARHWETLPKVAGIVASPVCRLIG
jgi:hypothetical protein